MKTKEENRREYSREKNRTRKAYTKAKLFSMFYPKLSVKC